MSTGAKPIETQEMLVNMGPQHPSTHGVLRLVLAHRRRDRPRGRARTSATCTAAPRRSARTSRYDQFIPYTDRMDYLAAMNINLGSALAVEKLLRRSKMPERARVIRVLIGELNRIASHLVGIRHLRAGPRRVHAVPLRVPRARAHPRPVRGRLRRAAHLQLHQGRRRHGTCRRSSSRSSTEFLDYFEPQIDEYNDLLSFNHIFLTRTKGLGVISPEAALDWGLTGPNLRASGINYDVRKAMPYSSYEKFQFNVPLGSNDIGTVGDCWNRYWLRIVEMTESCKIIKQAMDALPAGKYAADLRKIKPAVGEAYTAIENPRGELGFYIVSDGSEIPTRCKVRAPSFVNLAIMSEVGKNNLIADLIAILGSIDIVLGEIDRLTSVPGSGQAAFNLPPRDGGAGSGAPIVVD